MSEEHAERSAEERAFIERVSRAYAPPEPTRARRAAFVLRLEQRLQRPRRVSGPWLAAASVAAAATAVWIGAALIAGPDVEPGLPVAESRAAEAAAQQGLLVLATDSLADPDAGLPDDYLAIESFFLGS